MYLNNSIEINNDCRIKSCKEMVTIGYSPNCAGVGCIEQSNLNPKIPFKVNSKYLNPNPIQNEIALMYYFNVIMQKILAYNHVSNVICNFYEDSYMCPFLMKYILHSYQAWKGRGGWKFTRWKWQLSIFWLRTLLHAVADINILIENSSARVCVLKLNTHFFFHNGLIDSGIWFWPTGGDKNVIS